MEPTHTHAFSRRQLVNGLAAGAAAALVSPGAAAAAVGSPPAALQPLRKFNVTVRRFDPRQGVASGEEFVLPVDSPDEEHAVSAVMSNVVAFTTKVRGSEVLPVAFSCTGVRERR